uniref:Uncharacterized protein n=1 Tax=Tanacetum cinerariifolium TaxID=118510 RepID=A0A699IAE8_TANCI|nr:hypothetical protein [Tanacetum cinerariifolium]
MCIQGDARDAYVVSPVEYLHKTYVKYVTEYVYMQVVFNPTLVPSTKLLCSTKEIIALEQALTFGISKMKIISQ